MTARMESQEQTGREAGGNGDFRRGGLGVSPYPRRIQRPLKSITAPRFPWQ